MDVPVVPAHGCSGSLQKDKKNVLPEPLYHENYIAIGSDGFVQKVL
jgi:hypothetical protein